MLTKLRVLCAFGLQSYDSYHRVEDDSTSRWVGWGTENRDLPFRGIDPAHWELRIADTTANFYLFLAVAVAAGSAGLREKTLLTWKDCRLFPDNFTEEERRSYDIVENLPFSFGEAMNLDSDVREWIGEEFLGNISK